MSDPVNMARSARERLAQALGALQQPGVPAHLLGVAEPVAQAMSALHQIESTGGGARAQAAPRALDGVRRALGALQQDNSGHGAVISAIEAVAGTLSLVHGLANPAPAQAAAAQPAPAARSAAAFAGTVAAASQGSPPTQPSPPQRAPSSAKGAPPAMPPQAARQAAPAPAASPPQAVRQAAPAPAAVHAPPAAVAPPSGDLLKVNAELGVHSATNFYKGLAGNDLFDSGGIFIATYQIPKIGRALLIHVSMPGGYEFDAKGVVRWTREAPMSGPAGVESPPGFGAQFTELSPEGRQLIQRYVRNREPLFHDDL